MAERKKPKPPKGYEIIPSDLLEDGFGSIASVDRSERGFSNYIRRAHRHVAALYGARRHRGTVVIPEHVYRAYRLVDDWLYPLGNFKSTFSFTRSAAMQSHWRGEEFVDALETTYSEGGPDAVRALLRPPVLAQESPSE